MTKTIYDLKVGDQCHIRRHYVRKGEPEPMVVQKVGRTLIHVNRTGTNTEPTIAFYKDTGGEHGDESGGKLIPDIDAWNERRKLGSAYSFIRLNMTMGQTPQGITIADIRQAAALLKIELPEDLQ